MFSREKSKVKRGYPGSLDADFIYIIRYREYDNIKALKVRFNNV